MNFRVREFEPADEFGTNAQSYVHYRALVDGGTEELGHKVADGVICRIANGQPLRHALILTGSLVTRPTEQIVIADTPLNRGLKDRLGVKEDLDSLTVGSTFKLTRIKRNARILGSLSFHRDSDDELHPEEEKGMRKRLRDVDGSKIDDAGILILPRFALRTIIVGHAPSYIRELY